MSAPTAAKACANIYVRVIFRQRRDKTFTPRAQPEVKEIHIPEQSKNHVLTFHVGKVSEQCRKTMINNYHVFNLSNCSVVFKM